MIGVVTHDGRGSAAGCGRVVTVTLSKLITALRHGQDAAGEAQAY
jgi:hypothetical protein